MPGANELGLLYDGSVASESIDLGDVDTYTFRAQGGEKVTLTMSDVNGTALQPRIAVYRPSGTLLGGNHGGTATSFTATLPEAGTYAVVVTDYLGTHAGSYTLALSGAGGTAPATADVPLPPWALGLLALGIGASFWQRRRGR